MPKFFPHLRFDQFLSFLFISAGLLMLPTTTSVPIVKASAVVPLTEVQAAQPKLTTDVTIPIFIGSEEDRQSLATISATAVYVMDRDSGSVLFEKSADEPRYLASTAKMMTALVAKDIYPLDKVLTVKEEAFTTGTTAHLQLGEEMTVHNLLFALLIPSGNDAAFVLANNHSLGYSGFITAMNEKAKQLHLTHTHFNNPSGLDQQEQQSSARDLAILAHELLKDSLLREVVGTKETTITDVSGKVPHLLWNTHTLLHTLPGVFGVKTGTTEFAGENVVTAFEYDGHQLVVVVLGSKDRYTETKQILSWVEEKYQWKEVNGEEE